MTTLTFDTSMSTKDLVRVLSDSYGRPVGQLLRQHRTAALRWTHTGARIAGREAVQAFGGFFIELANDFVEIQYNQVAIEKHRLAQELNDWRHESALGLAENVLRESIEHRARSIEIIEAFRVRVRAERDHDAYRMLSEALQEINLIGDAHWEQIFAQVYEQNARPTNRSVSQTRPQRLTK